MSAPRTVSNRSTSSLNKDAGHQGPVSMRDIADAMGVSISTVSLALAGRSVVAERTREAIRQTAEQMGYRKNPMIAALMESRRRGRSLQNSPVIAYITAYDTRDGWRTWPAPNYFDGINDEAKRLGYKLEVFWGMDPKMRNGRLSNILRARGIQSAIVQAPSSASTTQLGFAMDWSRLSVVTVSSTLFNLNFDWACSDHFMNMRQVIRRCIAGGYKRIALFVREIADHSLAHRWLGAYLAEMHVNGLHNQMFPFMDDVGAPANSEECSIQRIAEWLERAKPEVIVGSIGDASLMRLQRAGIRVPEDVSVVSCTVPQIGSNITGICENLEDVGIQAVRHVVHLMHRNVAGIPTTPQMLVSQGLWNEGETFRPASKSTVGKKARRAKNSIKPSAAIGKVAVEHADLKRPSLGLA